MVMLLSSYNHEQLSGESFEDHHQHHHQHHYHHQAHLPPEMLQQPPSNCGMQELMKQQPQQSSSSEAAGGGGAGAGAPPGGGGNNATNGNTNGSTNGNNANNPARALRIKPQPNQVLKCPRCNSLNTKFCYYNNYCLTQPRHFCKNCRRYWTKGGALRNVPVGGGCRKNKRAKQKNSSSGDHHHSSAGATAAGGSSDKNSQSLGCSTSSLYDLGVVKNSDDDGLGAYSRYRVPDHSGTSSISFEHPRGSGSAFSLPISLPGFDGGPGTLNFPGLIPPKPEGGEFTPMYDPSLNLLGSVSAPLSEAAGLGGFNLGLEAFAGLGLNVDRWRQQQQKNLLDADHQHGSEPGNGIHLHHHHGNSLLHHLEDAEGLTRNAAKVLSKMNHNVNDGNDEQWQPNGGQHHQETYMEHHHHQQQQAHVQSTGETTYWNGTTGGWPMVDLPIYVDQQYCDVKESQAGVPDFYPRVSTMSRCAPSLP